MKCNIITPSTNKPCKNNVVSGLTLSISSDQVAYCCNQHYKTYKNNPAAARTWVTTTKVTTFPIPTVQEDTMNTTPDKAHPFQQSFAAYAGNQCDICGNKEGEYPHVSQESPITIAEQYALPITSVTGSNVKEHNWIKCVKCTKEIGEAWYHPTSADVRTCMGAAPATKAKVGQNIEFPTIKEAIAFAKGKDAKVTRKNNKFMVWVK